MLAIKIGANAPSAITDNTDRYQKPDRPGLENTGEENDQRDGIEQRSHQAIIEAQLHLGNILLLFLLRHEHDRIFAFGPSQVEVQDAPNGISDHAK